MLELKTPYLSPEGFAFYPVSDATIIQVYDKSLPKAVIPPRHDHTFDQTTSVVFGQLQHTAYDFAQTQNGAYCLWGTRPWLDGEEHLLTPLPGMKGDISVFEDLTLRAGYQFKFRAGWFHEVEPFGYTVVVMVKTRKEVTPSPRFILPVEGRFSVGSDEPKPLPAEYAPLVERALELVSAEMLYA